MKIDNFKEDLKTVRQDIIKNQSLNDKEKDDLKAAIIMLIMYVNHRAADDNIDKL